jgi:transcriptional regulator with XRE-family HTH domain
MKLIDVNSRDSGGDKDGPREYVSIPWSGNLDEAEISRPGGLLLAALIRCANERRLQLNNMADELGVTYGYINQLRNGIRKVSQVSDEFALACSYFLGIPRLTILMLAGRLHPEDLFEQDNMLAMEVTRAMGFICDDLIWGHLITPELRSGSEHSQFAVVKLYEAATGKVLMDKSLQYATLGAEITKLRDIQAKKMAAIATHSKNKKRSGD